MVSASPSSNASAARVALLRSPRGLPAGYRSSPMPEFFPEARWQRYVVHWVPCFAACQFHHRHGIRHRCFTRGLAKSYRAREVLAKASTRRTSVVKAEHQGYERSAKHGPLPLKLGASQGRSRKLPSPECHQSLPSSRRSISARAWSVPAWGTYNQSIPIPQFQPPE
jgi:hypothetical protein